MERNNCGIPREGWTATPILRGLALCGLALKRDVPPDVPNGMLGMEFAFHAFDAEQRQYVGEGIVESVMRFVGGATLQARSRGAYIEYPTMHGDAPAIVHKQPETPILG